MKYTKEQLQAAIDEISTDLQSVLKSEQSALQEQLKKSEDMEKCGEVTAKAEGPGEDLDDAAPAMAPEASAEASPAPEAGMDPAAEQQDQPPSLEELVQAYSQLSPEEISMHEQALQAAKQASAPAMPGSPSPGPGAQAPMAGEGSAPLAPGSEMALKSEKLQAEFDSLKKSQDTLVEAMKAMLSGPQRKAVTGNDMAPGKTTKPATSLSKAEVNAKLKVVARQDLQKSDRDLISNYFKNQVKVDDIVHLLNK